MHSSLERSVSSQSFNKCTLKFLYSIVGSKDQHHLSSFKCGFRNIFSRQNLLRSLSRLLFLLWWHKYGAKKCLENHIPFDFSDDSTLANQGAGKTIEKPLKELPWNQQSTSFYGGLYCTATLFHCHYVLLHYWSTLLLLYWPPFLYCFPAVAIRSFCQWHSIDSIRVPLNGWNLWSEM